MLRFLFLTVLLVSCSPYTEFPDSPTNNFQYCEEVRLWVKGGLLALEKAIQLYSECAPFEDVN